MQKKKEWGQYGGLVTMAMRATADQICTAVARDDTEAHGGPRERSQPLRQYHVAGDQPCHR